MSRRPGSFFGLFERKSGVNHGWCVVAGAVVLLAGCKDSGLPHKNKPLAVAVNEEWRYPLYEAIPSENKSMSLDGRTWLVTGATEVIPARMLTPVASVDGAEILSLKSDAAPYERLYKAGTAGAYSVVAPVD